METGAKHNGEKEELKQPLVVDQQNGKNDHSATDAGSKGST